MFRRAAITPENGNKIILSAPENSPENRYVASLKLNGSGYDKNFFTYEDLTRGAKIEFGMCSEPDRERGSGPGAKPYSSSGDL